MFKTSVGRVKGFSEAGATSSVRCVVIFALHYLSLFHSCPRPKVVVAATDI